MPLRPPAQRQARRLLRSDRFERPRLAYRDVASATNRLTLIAAILPAGCVSTHTVFCLRTPLPRSAQHFLCGLFNSLVVNYLVRLRVTTHVTTAVRRAAADPAAEHRPSAEREIAAARRRCRAATIASALDPAAGLRRGALYQLSARGVRARAGDVSRWFPRADRDAAPRSYGATEALRGAQR